MIEFGYIGRVIDLQNCKKIFASLYIVGYSVLQHNQQAGEPLIRFASFAAQSQKEEDAMATVKKAVKKTTKKPAVKKAVKKAAPKAKATVKKAAAKKPAAKKPAAKKTAAKKKK